MPPFNGSGTFNRSDGTRSGTQVWQDARDAGVKIRADDHDTHDQDIADGLENTVTLDGQNTTTTDNAILRYDSGNSQFEGVTISASELVGRSATGDVRSLSAATARQTIGLGTAASTNNAVLQYSSADGQYVEKTTITSVDIGSGVNIGSGVTIGSGVNTDPEHATDSGTDAFVSATNTTPPADGVKITRDFQSANTTTTPTLDSKTMTTRDGSALWAGAVSGPHELQRDQTADTYLLLDPIPNIPRSTDLLDEDNMGSNSDTAVPTQQSVKAFALTSPATSGNVALSFDTWRTPSTSRAVLVIISALAQTDGTTTGRVDFKVDESGGTAGDYTIDIAYIANTGTSESTNMRGKITAYIPAGGSYRVGNAGDPDNANTINDVREYRL